MSGKVLTVIQNIYQHTKSAVRINGQLSQPFSSNAGVMQGDNLSPLLFAIYLNDFDQFLATRYSGISVPCPAPTKPNDVEINTFLRLYVLLYADDSIILAESAEELQKALDALHEYCKINARWELHSRDVRAEKNMTEEETVNERVEQLILLDPQ